MPGFYREIYATIGSKKKGEKVMKLVMIISIMICIIVVLVTALVTSKAYSVNHTVDPMPTDDDHNQSEENKLS